MSYRYSTIFKSNYDFEIAYATQFEKNANEIKEIKPSIIMRKC